MSRIVLIVNWSAWGFFISRGRVLKKKHDANSFARFVPTHMTHLYFIWPNCDINLWHCKFSKEGWIGFLCLSLSRMASEDDLCTVTLILTPPFKSQTWAYFRLSIIRLYIHPPKTRHGLCTFCSNTLVSVSYAHPTMIRRSAGAFFDFALFLEVKLWCATSCVSQTSLRHCLRKWRIY